MVSEERQIDVVQVRVGCHPLILFLLMTEHHAQRRMREAAFRQKQIDTCIESLLRSRIFDISQFSQAFVHIRRDNAPGIFRADELRLRVSVGLIVLFPLLTSLQFTP